jgi:hypothetical protein
VLEGAQGLSEQPRLAVELGLVRFFKYGMDTESKKWNNLGKPAETDTKPYLKHIQMGNKNCKRRDKNMVGRE